MKAANLLGNRLFWKIVGAILIGLLIWLVGPLIAIGGFRPLAGFWLRLFLAILPLMLVGLLFWLERRRAARRNAAMIDELAPTRVEAREMASKLDEALAKLRTLKLGKRGAYLYQLPWYAIIGPSRAGKTTALLNSGLQFPTAEEGSYRALRGQPNTPNCEWWFTDEAVLIDTAGRFVSQDENAPADAEGWRNFLELLKRHRPLQPLNGIIVAIPAPDLSDATLLDAHLANLRARLWEIGEQLAQDLPIYVMITKADLIFGFREFFVRSDEDESSQVLGSTAPDPNLPPNEAIDVIRAGFDALITSLAARLPDRMQLEPHLPSRARIAAFPQEMASLRRPLGAVLERIVQATRFEKPPRIRGVYFSSGTQTGNPVDRLLMIAGMPPPVSETAIGRGRSYFLRRFFSDLVVPEAGLAGENPGAERRSRLIYTGSIAAALAALVIVLGVWTWGYSRNVALIESMDGVIVKYRDSAQAAGPAGSASQLAPLDVLADAVDRYTKADDFGLGLGQGPRLANGVRGIYRRDLKQRLTPLLVSLAERGLAAHQSDPSALYDDLKAYMILGGAGDADQVNHLVTWAQTSAAVDPSLGDAHTGSVARHTAALVEGGLNHVALDPQRRDEAQQILRNVSAAVRVWGRIKSEALRHDGPLWTARANAGSLPDSVFDPGGSMAPGTGIPQLFTRAGHDKLFASIAANPGMLREEKWVVGSGAGGAVPLEQMASLASDVEDLYFLDFLRIWRAYLAGLKPRAVTSLDDNIERLRAAGDPASPIPRLLRAISVATDFSSLAGRQSNIIASMTPSRLSSAAATARRAGIGIPGDGKTKAIAEFQLLRTYVGTDPATSQMTAALNRMTQISDLLTQVSTAQGQGSIDQGAPGTIEATAQIKALRQSVPLLPQPIASIVEQFSTDALGALGIASQQALQGAIGDAFGSGCAQTLAGRYPINASAQADLPVADFARYFVPDSGSFAVFLRDASTMIDRRNGQQWLPANSGGQASLSQEDVTALQSASLVTAIFFPPGRFSPQLSYTIEPVSLSGADKVTLRLHGQSAGVVGPISGMGNAATFDWPGEEEGSSIEFQREGRPPATRTWPGAWGVFRMMRAASLGGGEQAAAPQGRLEVDGSSFAFRVRTGGLNPFGGAIFARVHCLSSRPSAI